MLRGAGITAAAFAISAALFAAGLPVMSRGWSLKQFWEIFISTATLGLLMVGPFILLAGVIAGFTYIFSEVWPTKLNDKADRPILVGPCSV
jgi:hypothetical protein